MVPNKPSPEFEELVAAAIENAGINTDDCIPAAQAAAKAAAAVAALYPTHNKPRLIEADPDEILYNITFELPDVGLIPTPTKTCPLGPQKPLRILSNILRNLAGVEWGTNYMTVTCREPNFYSWARYRRTGVLSEQQKNGNYICWVGTPG